MSTYATILLTLHGVYLWSAILKSDTRLFFTILVSTSIYMPVIGRAMGWW